MEKLKYLYSVYRRYVILGISIIITILLGCVAFFVIHSKYSSINEQDNTHIIAKVEEKNTSANLDKEVARETIKIDIKGFVSSPGVYEFIEGARVVDAINKAGGLLDNAYTRYINLSKKLEDETVLVVNSKEEIEEIKKGENNEIICENINTYCLHTNEIITNNYEEKNTSNNLIESKEETNNSLNTSVNINKASKEELMTLKGIGESKALKIIEYRTSNGEFQNIEDIMNVSGIGEAMYEKIKDYITVK